MKAALQLCWICLFSITSLHLHSQTASKDYTYTIHVGAFVKANLADFEKIRPLGFMYAEVFDNSLLRIYLGDYANEKSAEAVLAKIKTNGYPDAYITRKDLSRGVQKSMIQLGTAAFNDQINWERYALAGPLYVQQVDKSLKIMTGMFDDLEMAQRRLRTIRGGGFKDAFIKNVNEAMLHEVTSFEAGRELQQNTIEAIPDAYEETVTEKGEAPKTEDPIALVEAGTLTEKEATPPPAEAIPQSYDQPIQLQVPRAIPAPAIRKSVKRNSVLELQKVLKKSGAYTSSLDGFYGKGTAAGYERIMQQNSQLRKYSLLAKYTREMNSTTRPGQLQYYINTLAADTRNATKKLEASADPVAKVYLAYVKFVTQGQRREVDDLMNTAIKKAFKGYKGTKVPLDATLDYSYRSLDQLLQHLACVQSISKTAKDLPCWMLRQHPKEAAQAFSGELGLGMQQCDDFVNWQELKLLRTIAADLNPQGVADANKVAAYASDRARYLLSPQKLDILKAEELNNWHIALWNGLDKWAAKEGLHAKLVVPLRVTYFQSMVRLEDYFMTKNIKPKDARHLAIGVLRTMVDQHLNSYSS